MEKLVDKALATLSLDHATVGLGCILLRHLADMTDDHIIQFGKEKEKEKYLCKIEFGSSDHMEI